MLTKSVILIVAIAILVTGNLISNLLLLIKFDRNKLIDPTFEGTPNGNRPLPRIVDGTYMTITQAPWQVSIVFPGSVICGGSIIDNNWILTAASCTKLVLKFFS